eukprot:11663483-Ditylum_brightwellii.AAC.2
MRVKELQDELKKQGLVKRGNTSDLSLYLKQAMLVRVIIMDKNSAPTNTAASSSELPGFPDKAYWKELFP